MVHPIIQLQTLILTHRLLVQELRRRGARDPIRGTMYSQKWRRDFLKIVLYVLAHPSQLSHRPNSWFPSVPPRIRSYNLQLLRILNRFPDHLVVGHGCPRVSDPKQHSVHEEPHFTRFHVFRHDEERGRENQARPRVRRRLEVHEHSCGSTHGLAEEESWEEFVRLAVADVEEER